MIRFSLKTVPGLTKLVRKLACLAYGLYPQGSVHRSPSVPSQMKVRNLYMYMYIQWKGDIM